MPGKRADNKVSKGLWIEDTIRDMAVSALKKKGIDFSEVVENLLLSIIDEQLTEAEKNEIIKKTKQNRQKKAVSKAGKICKKA